MRINRIIAIALVLGAMFAAPVRDAAAQKLSDRPITIIVPYSPGTGPDILARLIGEEIQSAGVSRSRSTTSRARPAISARNWRRAPRPTGTRC